MKFSCILLSFIFITTGASSLSSQSRISPDMLANCIIKPTDLSVYPIESKSISNSGLQIFIAFQYHGDLFLDSTHMANRIVSRAFLLCYRNGEPIILGMYNSKGAFDAFGKAIKLVDSSSNVKCIGISEKILMYPLSLSMVMYSDTDKYYDTDVFVSAGIDFENMTIYLRKSLF